MAPREQNIEADALSNGNFAGFTASRRIAFKELADLPFVVVPNLMLAAAELDTEIQFEKLRVKLTPRSEVKTSASQKSAVRLNDPW